MRWTLIYLEPVAFMLSKKGGKAVKIQMTREEVCRGSGPTSGAAIDIKIGAMNDGTLIAAEQILKFQAGAQAPFVNAPNINAIVVVPYLAVADAPLTALV